MDSLWENHHHTLCGPWIRSLQPRTLRGSLVGNRVPLPVLIDMQPISQVEISVWGQNVTRSCYDLEALSGLGFRCIRKALWGWDCVTNCLVMGCKTSGNGVAFQNFSDGICSQKVSFQSKTVNGDCLKLRGFAPSWNANKGECGFLVCLECELRTLSHRTFFILQITSLFCNKRDNCPTICVLPSNNIVSQCKNQTSLPTEQICLTIYYWRLNKTFNALTTPHKLSHHVQVANLSRNNKDLLSKLYQNHQNS